MKVYKIIPETNSLYKASECGNIRRVGSKKDLSQKTKSNGYKEVSLHIVKNKGKSRYVHRLVYSAFNGIIKDGLIINHKDGDKSNNNTFNIEAVSFSENSKHSYHVLGNKIAVYKGSNHGMSKLNESEVLAIRELYSNGFYPKELSEIYNISHGTICKICYRATWKHI